MHHQHFMFRKRAFFEKKCFVNGLSLKKKFCKRAFLSNEKLKMRIY